MEIKEITNYLESIAPLHFQEDYDNSGLLLGNSSMFIKGILITLDCNEAIIQEAIDLECNLIIAHHPIIFSGIKKINSDNYVDKTIIKAIKNDIAIYTMHTNLDNLVNGVNAEIAKRLGVDNCRVLSPKQDVFRKLVVYCPIPDAKKLKNTLFKAGAGNLGNYDECSFSVLGDGTFRPKNGSEPYLGNIGERHLEKEMKIEVIFPKNKERDIVSAMINEHPYEQVAYQIYILDNVYDNVGSGLIGKLKHPVEANHFFKLLKNKMQTDCVRHTKIVNKEITNVAICGGSGSFLLAKAISEKADIFISSDFKYHDFFGADENIIIADIGHYESEQFTKHLIYDLLTKKFSKFAIQLSKINTNPIKYF